MPDSLGSKYALLVGVGRHRYPDWSLPVTVNDVEALNAVLIDPDLCGYPDDDRQVQLLTNEEATREGVLAAMERLVDAASSDADSTVLVYFTGHGWSRSGEDYFLVTHDAVPHDLTQTALPATAFVETLRRIRAERLVTILDTCHAAGMATAKHPAIRRMPAGFQQQPMPKSLRLDLAEGSGRVVLNSCGDQQSSWIFEDKGFSIFSYHLIEALQGAGSSPGQETINVSDIMSYVGRQVRESAKKLGREQEPFFDFETTDFAVARICGGSGLPQGGWQELQRSSSGNGHGGRKLKQRANEDRRKSKLDKRLRYGLKLAYYRATESGADTRLEIHLASVQGKLKDSLLEEVKRYYFLEQRQPTDASDTPRRRTCPPEEALEECAEAVFRSLYRDGTRTSSAVAVIEEIARQLLVKYRVVAWDRRETEHTRRDRQPGDRLDSGEFSPSADPVPVLSRVYS